MEKQNQRGRRQLLYCCLKRSPRLVTQVRGADDFVGGAVGMPVLDGSSCNWWSLAGRFKVTSLVRSPLILVRGVSWCLNIHGKKLEGAVVRTVENV